MGQTNRNWAAVITLGAFVLVAATLAVVVLFSSSEPPERGVDSPLPAVSEAETPAAPVKETAVEMTSPAEAAAAEPTNEGRQVYGTVTDARTGQAVADAVVFAASRQTLRQMTITSDISADAPQTRTDANGAFELWYTDDSLRQLVCTAAGYARTMEDLEGQGKQRKDFFLQPGARISGQVTDASTGQGLADIKVFANPPRAMGAREGWNPNAQHASRTDGSGAYAIDNVPAGTYQVSVTDAREKGYTVKPQNVKTLSILDATPQEDVDFALDKGGDLFGTVVDVNNQPVEGARVSVMPAQMMEMFTRGRIAMDPGNMTPPSATTSPVGRFMIRGLEFELDYTAYAEKEDFAGGATDTFRLAENAPPKEVTIRLERGSRISGTAVYEDASPVADENLMLVSKDAGMNFMADRPRTAKTGEDGAFEFEPVTAGAYGIALPRQMMNPAQQTEVVVDGVNDVTGIQVVIQRRESGTGALTGVVIDAQGAPVAGALVRASNADREFQRGGTNTDENGRFQFTDLRGTSFNVSVEDEKGVGKLTGVAAGSDVTVRLSPPTALSGFVVSADGMPVPDVAVSISEAGDTQANASLQETFSRFFGRGGGRETTDVNGFFEFTNLAPATYTIKAESSTQGFGELSPVVVQEGTVRRDLRIQLQSGVQFSGVVVNNRGEAVAGASVTLQEASSGGMESLITSMVPAQFAGGRSATTGADGRFTLVQLAPGNYTVTASTPSYARYTANVNVPAGAGTSNYRIVLSGGGTVRGVYRVDGKPVQGTMIHFLGPEGSTPVMTDANGRFEIANLAPGSYMVNIIDMGSMMGGGNLGDMRPRVVDVADGQVVELDLSESAESAAGSLTGQINSSTPGDLLVLVRKDGAPPVHDIQINGIQDIINSVRGMGGTTVAKPGEPFSIDHLAPGDYVVEVFSLGGGGAPPSFQMMELLGGGHAPLTSQSITIGDQPVQLNLNVP